MEFRDIYLLNDSDNVKNIEANKSTFEIGGFDLELDFVERYEDADGIMHIKTVFHHNEIDESELWEVFDPKDGSNALELLLRENN